MVFIPVFDSDWTPRTSRELVILRDKNIRRSRVKGILSYDALFENVVNSMEILYLRFYENRPKIVPPSLSFVDIIDRKYFFSFSFFFFSSSSLQFLQQITRNPNVKAISKRYPYMRNGLKELSQYDVDWPEYDPQNQRYLNLSKFSRLSCRRPTTPTTD